MSIRSLLFTLLIVSGALAARGQQFITHGKIEFERKTNQHSLLEEASMWDEAMKKNSPKFHTAYYDLYFKDGLTLYKPGRELEVRQMKLFQTFPSDNTILTNLSTDSATTQKDIMNDLYIINAANRKIDWKIGTEIRKIAGFDCRKAVGRIMDSLVVIAFYTDEIIPSGGPESFNGLPGMILGLAIPRMHATWYATKLEVIEVGDKDLAAPKKGKKTTKEDFNGRLTEMLKDWGKEGQRMIPMILL